MIHRSAQLIRFIGKNKYRLSRSYTVVVLVIEYLNLEFICNLELAIWDFRSRETNYLYPREGNVTNEKWSFGLSDLPPAILPITAMKHVHDFQ